MDFAKRYPLLTTILSVCVIAFLVELFFLWKFSSNVAVAQTQLKKSASAAEAVSKSSPAPSQQNLDAATKNVADLKAELADVDHTLQDTPLKITDIPTKDVDLLSQIQSYKDGLNQKAKDKGIIVPNDYNYGFGMSLYVGKGVSAPAPEKFPAVYKQMKVLDYILNHLFDDAKLPDQKMKIISVEREDVTAVVVPTASAYAAPVNPDEGGTASDFFVIPPTITARVPDAINTLAFRIRFIAHTESLRILLNDLAKFELPLVVRSIEVVPAPTTDRSIYGAPATAGRSALSAANAAPDNRKPVVTENYSQFTITIEYVELPAPPKPADADAAASGTAPAGASGTAPAAASASGSAP
ncbi:MAG TPA: Amuc_1100 family pilus-like protein [Opitutales bacterium]|nr:Amuc_1100 family pilus-like protein [Opitutales bacterium]